MIIFYFVKANYVSSKAKTINIKINNIYFSYVWKDFFFSRFIQNVCNFCDQMLSPKFAKFFIKNFLLFSIFHEIKHSVLQRFKQTIHYSMVVIYSFFSICHCLFIISSYVKMLTVIIMVKGNSSSHCV